MNKSKLPDKKSKKRHTSTTPSAVEYSHEVSASKLKSLERYAYSNLVKAFRAQGPFTEEKKRMLSELQSALNISVSSHKTELQCAVNCKNLRAIAESIAGPGTSREWMLEAKWTCPPASLNSCPTQFSELADEVVQQFQKLQSTSQRLVIESTSKIFFENPDVLSEQQDQNVDDTDITLSDTEMIDDDLDDCIQEIPVTDDIKELSIKGDSRKEIQKRPCEAGINDVPHKIVVIDPSPEGLLIPDNSFNEMLLETPRKTEPSAYSISSANEGKQIKSAKEFFSKSNSIFEESPLKGPLSFPKPPSLLVTSSGAFTKSSVIPILNTSGLMSSTFQHSSTQSKNSDTLSVITAFSPSFQSTLATSCTSPKFTASVVNSLRTPLVSVTESLVANASSTITKDSEPKLKTFSAPVRKSVRPKLVRPTTFNAESHLLISSSSTPQHSISNSLNSFQKNILSLKSCSSVVTSSLSSLSSVSSTLKRSISPLLPRISPVTSTSTVKCPSPVKCTKIPESSTKTSVPSQSLCKLVGSMTCLGTRTLSSSISSQSSVSETVTTSVLKTPKTLVLPPSKGSHVNTGHKLISSPIVAKPTPATRNIKLTNDGGLKIMSQNMNVPKNPVIPKLTISASSKTATMTTAISTITTISTSTSGLTKGAKIVSLPHPIKIDRSRLNLYRSTALSASNSIVTTSVIQPNSNSNISSASGRPTLVMKPEPNIVVVKAQTYSHASGAAIIVPSTTTLTRLSDKSIGDAVAFIERKIPGRFSASLSEKIKVPSNQQVITSSTSLNSPCTSRTPWILPKIKDAAVPIKTKIDLKRKTLDSSNEPKKLQISKDGKCDNKHVTDETKSAVTLAKSMSVEKLKTPISPIKPPITPIKSSISTEKKSSVKKNFIKPIVW